MTPESENPKRAGYLNRSAVVAFSFWITTACIVVAVVASILAIWEFTGADALWRTVATCAVIGGGTLAFSWINGMFARRDGSVE
jgi:NO-binding membrane sensor protein with MHYT domain